MSCKTLKLTALPVVHVSSAREGMVVFSGALPMARSIECEPSRLAVTLGANFVQLAGTTTTVATYLMSVAATNCNGKVASHPVTLHLQ